MNHFTSEVRSYGERTIRCRRNPTDFLARQKDRFLGTTDRCTGPLARGGFIDPCSLRVQDRPIGVVRVMARDSVFFNPCQESRTDRGLTVSGHEENPRAQDTPFAPRSLGKEDEM